MNHNLSKIAQKLIECSRAKGLRLNPSQLAIQALGGGNTSASVAEVSATFNFVVKADETNAKVAREGALIRRWREDQSLPKLWRDSLPEVYAVSTDPPSYLMKAYLPVDGWVTLSDRLYPTDNSTAASPAEALRMLYPVLDRLTALHEATLNRRLRPALGVDYLQRILERMTDTAALDGRFNSRPIHINGVRYDGWAAMLEVINNHPEWIESITPPYSTDVQGDPHPGNVLLKIGLADIDVRFIDNKDWKSADPLWDFVKLSHWNSSTAAIERPAAPGDFQVSYCLRADDEAALTYGIVTSPTARLVEQAIVGRAEAFAVKHGDPHWQARWELAMASNLLGLPLARLKTNPDAALALYAIGLEFLAQFIDRTSAPDPGAQPSPPVEPQPLRDARELVTHLVPDATAALDRRGFKLLQWPPLRANSKGKPAELSLEHEARLKPATPAGLQALREGLAAAEGLSLGQTKLLPEHGQFDGLMVKRYQRPAGPQSVDRYHDSPQAAPGMRLIARGLTLRERLRGSGFMTWNADEAGARPLNLELPSVPIDGSQGRVAARLEFNMIDDLKQAMAELADPQTPPERLNRSPIHLAQRATPFDTAGLVPVLEHTTFREKFGLLEADADGAEVREVFHVNIDTITAQSLLTGRVGSYVDIDIAPVGVVDEGVLARLVGLAEALAARFDLQAIGGTKAWRSARATGYLEAAAD